MTWRDRAPTPALIIAMSAAILAAALFAWQVWLSWSMPGSDAFAGILLRYSVLPRGAIAILAGASLGLAGALLQRVLRNPIADASTLGIAAGAQLAMTAATLYAPVLMESAREPLAFVGGSLALLLVLALASPRGLDPVTVVICGLMVSLSAASLSAVMILANGEYMMSLFIWGGGVLDQQGWGPSLSLAFRLALAAMLVAALFRPLLLLGLDEASARSLGLGVSGMRLVVLGIAVGLATSVTAGIGLIGFIGLAAPHLARLAGARTLKATLVASPIVGAILLWLTDGLVKLATLDSSDIVPTGAATALLGGPLLLWLLPRLASQLRPAPEPSAPMRLAHPRRGLSILAGATLILFVLALLVGRGGGGWTIAYGDALQSVLPWRLPRIVAGAAAGAMLAAAGLILQRVTGNPMASPEVLGVSSGAGIGLAIVLVVFGGASRALELAGSIAGACAALVLVLLVAARGHFGPERLLLGGIAVGAFCGAGVTAIMARGGPEALRLLNWLSGTTQSIGPRDALVAAGLAIFLLAPLPFLRRWLEILPLGGVAARSIGLAPHLAGGGLTLAAALLTATATLVVGPLSFVGLMAPHLAHRAGFARPSHHLAAAILYGTMLMILADWLSRTLTFPYQLPLGLFASLVGGPYLVWLLNRPRTRPL